MKLYIIYHGRTDWSAERKIQGRQDTSLNAIDRSQAEMLVKGMEKRPVTVIYSNPQIWAVEMIKTPTRTQEVMVIPVPELAEIGCGDWEGRTASDILAREWKLYEGWWQHSAVVAPPGGETLNQVNIRYKETWERVKGGVKGDTTAITHGGTLAHFIAHLLEGQPDMVEILVGNASITIIEYDPITGQRSLVGLNGRSHLM